MKTLIIGGVALRATGHGLKSIYELYQQAESSDISHTFKELCDLLDSVAYTPNQSSLDRSVLEFDDKDFQKDLQDIHEVLKDYVKILRVLVTHKPQYIEFDQQEKELFHHLNTLRRILCDLFGAIAQTRYYVSGKEQTQSLD